MGQEDNQAADLAEPGSSRKSKAKENAEDILKKKWGKNVVDLGWAAVPNILIDRQQALKINSVELNILLVLMKYWWSGKEMPFPSKKTIAETIGKDSTTVQRNIRNMEARGLLKRERRNWKSGGQSSNVYDLSGLIAQLKPFAAEEVKLKKKQEQDEAVKRRGHGGTAGVEEDEQT